MMRAKTKQQRRLSGTDRRDRKPRATPPLPALDGVPTPPKWMPNEHAVAEWHRLAPILRSNNLLTRGNLQLLAHLAALHGRIVQTYRDGGTPPAAHVTVLRNLHGDLGLLGMRLPPPPPPEAANRFAAFRRRPADGAKGA